MLDDYFTKPLQGALLHKFREIIMGRFSPFTILENTFSYTSKKLVEKQIPLKEISSGTGEPLKETKNMLEEKNEKQVLTITAEPPKNKYIPKYEEGKRVRNCSDVVSTRKLSNNREK